MQARSARSSTPKPTFNSSFTKLEYHPSNQQLPLKREDVRLDPQFHSRSTKPKSFWQDLKNQRNFLQYIANQLAITKTEDWYKVELEDVKRLGGFDFARQYGGSVPVAIASLFPNSGLHPWKFSKVPKGFWDSIENQRSFFDWLGEQLHITSYTDWYEVSAKTITEYGGGGLLAKKYDSSVRKAIMNIFPEHHWVVWRFKARVPDGYWDHEENVRSFLQWCVDQLELKHPHDWLQISREQLMAAGGKSLLEKYGGILPMLAKYYPQIDWAGQAQKLRNNAKLPSSKTQQLLIKSTRLLFPSMDIRTNYRHSELIFKNTNREMELDIFIPQLSLAFEYQGPQHYEWTTLYGSPEMQKQRDEEKKATCSGRGITLIEVPFWWVRSTSSVAATILKHRPDVAPYIESHALRHSQTIPAEMPKRVRMMLKKNTANRIILSDIKKWDRSLNPANSLVCNRVEGIRFLWDGDSILRTQDEILNVPTSLLNGLPRMPLDGVITFGQGDISQWWQVLSKKSEGMDPLWNSCKLYIYDSPQLQQPYEERIRIIEQHLATQNDQVILMKPRKVNSETELDTTLQQAQSEGFAGLYIRKPSSLYMDHDAWFMLQKPEQDYAGVVNLVDNTITCKLPGGPKFTIELPSNGQLRQTIQAQLDKQETPVLAIQYQGLSNGSPVQPSFKELRPDIKWDSLANKFFVSKTAYFLSTGRKGTHPNCRGCKRKLDDKQELRISVKGAFTPLLQTVPVPVNLSVCANASCIEKALGNTGKNSGIFLPSYERIVAVPDKLKSRLDEVKQKLGDGVEYVIIE